MIDVRHVSKSFGNVVALDDVSLRVEPGERVGFVGTNGSGKTTLLRAMLGLVRVDGSVRIAEQDVSEKPEQALRSAAYIPQVAPPIEAPVSEVVRAFAALRRIDDKTVAKRASLLGLDITAFRKTRFRDLSGGMKQKLLAALALAANAEILVCDEPTANLDRESRAAFFDQVAARPKEAVTILCSHRAEEIERLVTRVVELVDGRIVRDAPTRTVIEDLRAKGAIDETRSDPQGGPMKPFVIAIALLLASCEDGNKPVDPVWGKQACKSCGMILSEPRFAAELSTREGERAFFDDPGCMASYVHDHNVNPSRMWVRSPASTWIDARGARYLRGEHTPMDYGFVPSETGAANWSDVETSVIDRSKRSEAP